MAETTDKFDIRRALILERVMKAWDLVPEMPLGRIIVEALDMGGAFDVLVLRGIDDEQLVERLMRYAMGLKK